MNIKSIKTRQFAGVKNKMVVLDDGLNLLVGDNETGKSTMIDLIYQILYRNSKLNAKKSEDKDFKSRFMPADSMGDVVDGTLVFTTAEGEYTLQKKWGASAGCELIAPGGTIIANEDRISEIIARELFYKKGLYDDVVFVSQKNQANVVEHILKKYDNSISAKRDLVSIIASEGMSFSGGIAPEDIEKVIQTKIDELSGRWDFTIDGPEQRRGIEKPWGRERGKILGAYYNLETLKEQLRKSENAEKAIDNDNAKIHKAERLLQDYQVENEEYERYARALATYKSGMRLKEEYSVKRKKIHSDMEEYPKLLKEYSDATYLSNLAKAKDVIDQYIEIQNANEKFSQAKKTLEAKTEISSEDENNLASLEKRIDNLQARLSNLNLVANITKLGNMEILVKSVATGEYIDITKGEVDINETVEITVPGIMNMVIAAKGVDVEEVQRQLEEMNGARQELLSKCRATDLADLREKREAYKAASREFETAKKEQDALNLDVNLSMLEADYFRLKEKGVELDDLDEKIKDLCGYESIDKYVGLKEQAIQSMEQEYGSKSPIDSMRKSLEEVDAELEKLNSVENDAINIPEKFLAIDDVEAYKEKLKKRIKDAQDQIDEAKKALREHEKELGDVVPDDLRARIDDEKTELQKYKDEHKKWSHILTVLRTTRDNMAGESTMSDVQVRFAEYLSVITNGRIALKSMDENMDVSIQSGDNPMTYEILSEGTKDTIALAFRLAMLEHLFPNGGGLVIFDDPFTEMDESRTKQACKLVQKFADARNQVIFVTCDKKYKSMLSGNVVEM